MMSLRIFSFCLLFSFYIAVLRWIFTAYTFVDFFAHALLHRKFHPTGYLYGALH